MSFFSPAFYLTAALTLSGLTSQAAFAQPAPDAMSTVSASHPSVGHSPASQSPMIHPAAASCFTEDLVPNDDSSMLTVCGVDRPSRIIFAQ